MGQTVHRQGVVRRSQCKVVKRPTRGVQLESQQSGLSCVPGETLLHLRPVWVIALEAPLLLSEVSGLCLAS